MTKPTQKKVKPVYGWANINKWDGGYVLTHKGQYPIYNTKNEATNARGTWDGEIFEKIIKVRITPVK